MSRFTSPIASLRQDLARRADYILRLRNVDPATLDRDAHYAILRLAQSVATEFPSADVEFNWTKETINYSLPPVWATDTDPIWRVECPSLLVDYTEALCADDALVNVGSDGAYLTLQRRFTVDSVEAHVYLKAYVPTDDYWLLRSIGKITTELEPAYERVVLAC